MDGRVAPRFVEQSLGNVHRPLSDAQLDDKFRAQAVLALPAAQASIAGACDCAGGLADSRADVASESVGRRALGAHAPEAGIAVAGVASGGCRHCVVEGDGPCAQLRPKARRLLGAVASWHRVSWVARDAPGAAGGRRRRSWRVRLAAAGRVADPARRRRRRLPAAARDGEARAHREARTRGGPARTSRSAGSTSAVRRSSTTRCCRAPSTSLRPARRRSSRCGIGRATRCSVDGRGGDHVAADVPQHQRGASAHARRRAADDKIAVTAIKVSIPALVMQMYAARKYGSAEATRFDKYTVTMTHPDARHRAAVGAATGISAHFTSPPFHQRERKDPQVRTIMTSDDVMGGSTTFTMLSTTSEVQGGESRRPTRRCCGRSTKPIN